MPVDGGLRPAGMTGGKLPEKNMNRSQWAAKEGDRAMAARILLILLLLAAVSSPGYGIDPYELYQYNYDLYNDYGYFDNYDFYEDEYGIFNGDEWYEDDYGEWYDDEYEYDYFEDDYYGYSTPYGYTRDYTYDDEYGIFNGEEPLNGYDYYTDDWYDEDDAFSDWYDGF